MSTILIEIAWSFLLSIGLFFVVIELKTRMAPSILFFGTTILLLCCFVGVDIWAIPRAPVERHLYWFQIQHVFASLMLPMLVLYLLSLLNRMRPRLVQAMFFVAALFAVLFMTPLLLHQRADGIVVGTSWYLFTFIPYFCAAVLLVHLYLLRNWRSSTPQQRRVMRFHFLGFAFLSACGLVDILMLFDLIPRSLLPGSSIIGVLGFGLLNSAVFLNHFAFLVNEYRETYQKLEAAYRDLEEANALKEIGMSSAMIAHEIKNYMFAIGGNAKLLSRSPTLSDKDRRKAQSIEKTVDKLNAFSHDILDMVRSRVVRDKRMLDLEQLVRKCVTKIDSAHQHRFRVQTTGNPPQIHGNWARLEQAFINIFRNAVEADAATIGVRIIRNRGMAVISIDDDGVGCTAEQAGNLFKAFYTTKHGSRGTGLGLSIVRAIVESHGGHISAYGKNTEGSSARGLRLNITFPVFEEEPADGKTDTEIAVVRSSMDCYPMVVRVLNNLHIRPRTFQSASEAIQSLSASPTTTILASPKAAPELMEARIGCPWFVVSSDPAHGIRIMPAHPDSSPELFSEEYVLSRLQA